MKNPITSNGLRYVLSLPTAVIAAGFASSLGFYVGGLIPDLFFPLLGDASRMWLMAGIFSVLAYYKTGFFVAPYIDNLSKWILIVPAYFSLAITVHLISGDTPEKAWNSGATAVFTVLLTFLSPSSIHRYLALGRLPEYSSGGLE